MRSNFRSFFPALWLFLALAFPFAAFSQTVAAIKWACIGNSITEGTTGSANSYPTKLGTKLGVGFAVTNYGVGWRTLLRSGDSTYWKYGRLAQVFAAQPAIISISLGTNDSKPLNWDDSASFLKDYRDLVDTLSTMASKPRIILLYPTPVFTNEAQNPQPADLIRESVIRNAIIPKIRQVAIEKGLDTIDLHTPFLTRSSMFPDGVHPNTAGYDTLASHIYRGYLSKVTRIATIGNSITQYTNSGVAGATAVNAWPIRLNMMLGRNFYVENEGISGLYMLKSGFQVQPYWTQGRLTNVFNLKPHVVTVMLGTNDSRPKAWNTTQYIRDYKAFIDTLRNTISPSPAVWLMRPLPAWQVGGAWAFSSPSGTTDNGINGDIIRDSVGPAVIQVAADKGISTIDMYSAFYAPTMPSVVVDGVHVNATGQDSIARVVYKALLPSLTALRAEQARTLAKPRIAGKARLVPVLNPATASPARLHSLNGKAVPTSKKGVAPGVYVVRPEKKEAKSGKSP